MLKLVILSPGMTGQTQELKAEKTTLGRLEDNDLPISEASVSSHHCEVRLRGNEALVRDLNSTNGTYIGGEKITEGVLKPGQILRLGQVQLRLESETIGPSGKKQFDRTTVIPGGVKLTELEQGARTGGFDTKSAGFARKDNRVNQLFIVIGVILGGVIIGLLLYLAATIKK